jgi:proteic killer suppression protein
MIRSIGHKGLKRLHEDDDPRGVIGEASMRKSCGTFLRASMLPARLRNLPGFRLHPLKGELKGFWAVTVRANWRVIFRFADQEALDVDYVDYH